MDSIARTVAASSPATKEKSARLKVGKTVRYNENVNPNESSLELKSCKSPSKVQSEKSAKKAASNNPKPNQVARVTVTPSLQKMIRERKFVISKKKVRKDEKSSLPAVACDKCKKMSAKSKCVCVPYENLRASQEDFFKNRGCEIGEEVFDKLREHNAAASEELESNLEIKKPMEKETGGNGDDNEVVLVELSYGRKGAVQKDAAAMLKRSRDNLLEETRRSVMAVSSGGVMNLVKEFEKLFGAQSR